MRLSWRAEVGDIPPPDKLKMDIKVRYWNIAPEMVMQVSPVLTLRP